MQPNGYVKTLTELECSQRVVKLNVWSFFESSSHQLRKECGLVFKLSIWGPWFETSLALTESVSKCGYNLNVWDTSLNVSVTKRYKPPLNEYNLSSFYISSHTGQWSVALRLGLCYRNANMCMLLYCEQVPSLLFSVDTPSFWAVGEPTSFCDSQIEAPTIFFIPVYSSHLNSTTQFLWEHYIGNIGWFPHTQPIVPWTYVVIMKFMLLLIRKDTFPVSLQCFHFWHAPTILQTFDTRRSGGHSVKSSCAWCLKGMHWRRQKIQL